MLDSRRAILESVKDVSSTLGLVASLLYSSKRGKVPFSVPLAELISHTEDSDFQHGVLHGALAILYAMGAVRFDGDGVAAGSRDSGFFLGSLSKFLDKSVAAIDDPLDDKRDFAKVTRVFETARGRKDQQVEVDQQPLHHRHIVNIVVKARMKREWQLKDVYLHEYDDDWKQYHLIGEALREECSATDLESDIGFAHSIMQAHLRLRSTQYDFHRSINPPVKCLEHISETSGAYTEYSYRLFVVENIDPSLSVNSHLREETGHGPYRWFTREEILNCCSAQGELIIFSTPALLKHLEPADTPVCVRGADDPRHRTSILKELGYRFSKRQLAGAALILAFLLALQLLPRVVGLLQISDPALIGFAAWAQIVSTIFTVGSALVLAARALLPRHED